MPSGRDVSFCSSKRIMCAEDPLRDSPASGFFLWGFTRPFCRKRETQDERTTLIAAPFYLEIFAETHVLAQTQIDDRLPISDLRCRHYRRRPRRAFPGSPAPHELFEKDSAARKACCSTVAATKSRRSDRATERLLFFKGARPRR